MKDPTQIAAEAAKDLCIGAGLPLEVFLEPVTKRFQDALDKATQELRSANDNLFKIARKHCVENKKHRAAHSSEGNRFTCPRCGLEPAHASEPTSLEQVRAIRDEWDKREPAHASEQANLCMKSAIDAAMKSQTGKP